MRRTSVPSVSVVRKRMPAIRSCSAALNVLPVPPVTRPVRIFKKNAAADLIGFPTSAMDAVNRSIIVRLPTNTPIMSGSLTENSGNVSRIPGPVSLTFFFTGEKLFLAFLMNWNTEGCKFQPNGALFCILNDVTYPAAYAGNETSGSRLPLTEIQGSSSGWLSAVSVLQVVQRLSP